MAPFCEQLYPSTQAKQNLDSGLDVVSEEQKGK